jgi:metallo-beta-lactamase class B
MFVEWALIAAIQISIPLGPRPRQVEQPRAPIEQAGPQWAAACGTSTEWDKPAPPVRIHGNTYYVGTCGIAAILVTGEDGHVLIDSGTEQGADLVADNIRALGFRLGDIKYLLHSHEHHDHVGGMARLQQLTGATVVASPDAGKVFATGAASADDPQAGALKPFPAVQPGRIIAEGETVRLRDIQLTAHAAPGHTPGALTWTWESCDGGVCRAMVFADSLSAVSRDGFKFTDRPALVAAFRASIARLASLRCEILMTPHPSASGLPERFAAGRPWLDADACNTHAAKLGQALDERLAKEASGP